VVQRCDTKEDSGKKILSPMRHRPLFNIGFRRFPSERMTRTESLAHRDVNGHFIFCIVVYFEYNMEFEF